MKISSQLHLYKQNFKFSAAHFLIFDSQSAERLHGHNYQVKVNLELPQGFEKAESSGKLGYSIDFHVIKKLIKEQIDLWDEYVLIPQKHPEIQTQVVNAGQSLELKFRDRLYVFPAAEVKLLPISNTSVEQFSILLAQMIFAQLTQFGILKLTVFVEETQGQSASATIEK